MQKPEYFNPSSLPPARGYTQVVRAGDTVYIAGQVSMAPDGSVVGKGDPEAQVRQVWRNLEAAARSGGATLQSIVKTTTYVTGKECMGAVRKVRDELFQSSNPPASTLLVVSALASPDFLVEIEATAVVSS